MTSNHAFYIPIIFFLGMFIGIITTSFSSRGQVNGKAENEITRIKGKTLASAFGVFLSIFILTHMLYFPGGVKALHSSLGHQPIFDMKSSFVAEEVYDRLEAFGETGRESYKHFTYTSDVIFPLSLLVFLLVLSKFIAERTTLNITARRLLVLIPFIWFTSDIIENGIVYNLLTSYPGKNIFLMTVLGPITTVKLIMLLVSIALPSIAFVAFRRK